jgi:hypothetical protein
MTSQEQSFLKPVSPQAALSAHAPAMIAEKENIQ